MGEQKGAWRRFIDWWTVQRVALILLLVAAVTGLLGYLNQHSGWFMPLLFITDFYANFSTELASIAITVLVIDTLNERRAVQQEKAGLILQMDSPTNSIAREAVRILRARGWLTDGSLQGAYLYRANLQSTFLVKADLRKANLRRANLKRAYLQKANLAGARDLVDEQLVQARMLRGAIMVNGNRYDGRFNLEGDLEEAVREGTDVNDPEAMAGFYGVSPEAYLRGQAWAKSNLAKLHAEVKAKDGSRGLVDHEALPINHETKRSHYYRQSNKPIYLLGMLATIIVVVKLIKDGFRLVPGIPR